MTRLVVGLLMLMFLCGCGSGPSRNEKSAVSEDVANVELATGERSLDDLVSELAGLAVGKKLNLVAQRLDTRFKIECTDGLCRISERIQK